MLQQRREVVLDQLIHGVVPKLLVVHVRLERHIAERVSPRVPQPDVESGVRENEGQTAGCPIHEEGGAGVEETVLEIDDRSFRVRKGVGIVETVRYAIETEIVAIGRANDVSLERIVLGQDKIFEKWTTFCIGDLSDKKGKRR